MRRCPLGSLAAHGRRRTPAVAGRSGVGSHASASHWRQAASNGAAASGGVVAILGVSPMTRRASELLHKAGARLIVVNRTMEVAEELARAVGGEAISLEAFRAQPRDVAGLIVATGGTEPVLDAQRGSPAGERRDEAAPHHRLRPAAEHRPARPRRTRGLARIGMDEMIQAAQDRRLAQLMRLAPMRAAIDERLTRIREQLASRAIGPQLAELRSSFQRIASAEADRAMTEELQQLDPQQQDNVRRLIETSRRSWPTCRSPASAPPRPTRTAKRSKPSSRKRASSAKSVPPPRRATRRVRSRTQGAPRRCQPRPRLSRAHSHPTRRAT